MTKRTQPAGTLSTRRVFVVHVGTAVDLRRGLIDGRVEHVRTGRMRRFERSEELLAFLADIHEAAASETADPASHRRP
jgi:hypothetical protein